MLSIGGESDSGASVGTETGHSLRIHQPHDPLLSPSIQRIAGETVPAFELKLVISEALACRVENWADEHLQRDSYADLRNGGSYETTTLYLDTPQLDVFHRSTGFRRQKFRLRRYGIEPTIFLERKTRRGDRVKKRRSDVPLADLVLFSSSAATENWSGHWFSQRIAVRSLRPTCRVSYRRTAFVKLDGNSPVRLTLDRDIRGMAASDWNLSPVHEGHRILPDEVICEFKFREAMPVMFRELIATLQLETGCCSKYRRMMTAAGNSLEASGNA